MTKTFWLSFCDGSRPRGQQFIGACVVDVTEDEMSDAKLVYPRARNHWVVAAMGNAWRDGCNPGGQMASVELTGEIPDIPRSRLMQKAELEALGLI